MSGSFKASQAMKSANPLKAYQDLVLGNRSWFFLFWFEFVMLLGGVPGGLGFFLRQKLYPTLLGKCGKGCVFGRGVTLRHPKKIFLGDRVIVDDNVLLDAKGDSNRGLFLGHEVYIGRNAIVYTKNGDIELGDKANISHNCELFSNGLLQIGADTVVAAYSYLLCGGSYEVDSPVLFSKQAGNKSAGPTVVGPNVWIAAHVVVIDNAQIGEGAVIGAGSIVRGKIPPRTLAIGIPARVIRKLNR